MDEYEVSSSILRKCSLCLVHDRKLGRYFPILHHYLNSFFIKSGIVPEGICGGGFPGPAVGDVLPCSSSTSSGPLSGLVPSNDPVLTVGESDADLSFSAGRSALGYVGSSLGYVASSLGYIGSSLGYTSSLAVGD